MSSRSNGVTKVGLTRLMMSWVASSAQVLLLAHPLGDRRAVAAVAEHLRQEAEPLTSWLASWVNRS